MYLFTYNNPISTTYSFSILSTQPSDTQAMDMFGSNVKHINLRVEEFIPNSRKSLYFKPFSHLTYLSLTSKPRTPRASKS